MAYRRGLRKYVIQKRAEKRGIRCVDLQEAFNDILKHRYPAFITWDRVHPGWIGSMVIARALLKCVGSEIKF